MSTFVGTDRAPDKYGVSSFLYRCPLNPKERRTELILREDDMRIIREMVLLLNTAEVVEKLDRSDECWKT